MNPPAKIAPDAHCNARTKSGSHCKKPAGWGTDTPGEGRCRIHRGRPPSIGLHSQRVLNRIIGDPGTNELIGQGDEELIDLRIELILAKTLLAELQEELAADAKLPEEDQRITWADAHATTFVYIEKIAIVAEKLHKMKFGTKIQLAFSEEEVRAFLQRLLEVLEVVQNDTRIERKHIVSAVKERLAE